MARTPKPWYWEERGSWYVTIRGTRHNLGADRSEARREFHALMSKPAPEPLRRADSVTAVVDRFLDWVQKNRAPDTYVWYQSRLQLFVTRHPDLTVEELRPIHVQEWIDSINGSPGTKRNYARTIQRAMRWAAQMGCIDVNPIAGFQKPKGGVRSTVLSPEQFQELLYLIRSSDFKELLTFAWETGARAAECLAVERRHVDLAGGRIVFPVEEEKTEAVNCAFIAVQHRLGRLRLKAEKAVLAEEEITACIAGLKPARIIKGKSVRKSQAELRGEARRKLWNRKATEKAPKYCLTVLRHSWCHHALRRGIDALTVSVLMGHADCSMVAKVYSHLSHAPDYLREAVRKATA